MINQSSAGGLKGLSRTVLTAVIAFVVAITVFASTAFAGLVSQYNVEIQIDNDSFVITTNETEPIEILSQANITLAESDKLDISAFTAGEGGTIKIDKLNNVNIEFDGVINTYSVYADTVEDALVELGINLGDDPKINYELTDPSQDGMVISIQSAKHVTLAIDGGSNQYAIYQGTVKDLLNLAQVTLGSDDYTEPAVDTQLQENMTVTVYRVEYKDVTVQEEVAYSTTKQNDDTADKGTETVVTDGVKGEADVTYRIKLVNGEQESKTELSRTVTKQPVDKVVKVGTKEVSAYSSVTPNGVQSKNGYSLGDTITGRYTHYCACSSCGTGSGTTASGLKVYNGMSNPYYVACNWLPLGSVISVNGTLYTVVDRGGSGLSTSGRIDIFTPEGHSACYQYGTGTCTIEIVRLGW
jgi:uncharacterized protein YabE (DUF348 family)